MKPRVILLLILLTGGCAFAQNQTTIRARCLSFQLQPSTVSDPIYGLVTTYFSTYDGRNDIAPLSTYSGGLYYYYGEVRHIGSSIYAADYIKYSPVYGFFEDGYFTAALPSTDSDANGVPDFLQLENAVNLTITVTKTRVYPSVLITSASMVLTREANQVFGTLTSTDGSATWGLAAGTGTLRYTRSANNPVSLSLYSANFTGVATHTTGNTTATINSVNQITTAQATLTEDAGNTTILPSLTFTRSGTNYTAH